MVNGEMMESGSNVLRILTTEKRAALAGRKQGWGSLVKREIFEVRLFVLLGDKDLRQLRMIVAAILSNNYLSACQAW